MNWIRHFAQELTKGHETDPWHGPSTKSLLEGLTAAQAASHPIRELHSIWEIVLHMDAWQREVLRRLDAGFIPEIPEEGDWRTVLEVSEKAWQAAVSDLDSSLHELVRVLNTMAKTADENTVWESSAGTLSGLLQHNAYHSGQIALLGKTLQQKNQELEQT